MTQEDACTFSEAGPGVARRRLVKQTRQTARKMLNSGNYDTAEVP